MRYTQSQGGLILTSNNTQIEISSGQDVTRYGSGSNEERVTLTPVEASMALRLLGLVKDDGSLLDARSERLGLNVIYLARSPEGRFGLFKVIARFREQNITTSIRFSDHNVKPLKRMLSNALETLTQSMNPGYDVTRVRCVHCGTASEARIRSETIILDTKTFEETKSIQGNCPECGEPVARLIVSAW